MMDPNATFRALLSALQERDRRGFIDILNTLAGWLHSGGFMPDPITKDMLPDTFGLTATEMTDVELMIKEALEDLARDNIEDMHSSVSEIRRLVANSSLRPAADAALDAAKNLDFLLTRVLLEGLRIVVDRDLSRPA